MAKRNIPGTFLQNPSLDGVILLSILQLVNVASIWSYWDLNVVTTTAIFDAVLCLILLLGLNYFYFIHKNRIERIIKKFDERSYEYKFLWKFITYSYVIASCWLLTILNE